MSTQMQLARAPWGLGWRLAGGASPAPGISPSSPAVPGAPEDGEPFDDSPQNQTGAPRSGLPPRRANSVGTTLMGPPASAPQPVYDNPTSLKSRIGAAIQGLGATLNPQGSGLESFLSGATGAYTRTQEGLDYNANLPYYEDRQRRTDAFTDQDNAAKLGLTGAQTDYYQGLAAREQADANAPASPTIRGDPTGQLGTVVPDATAPGGYRFQSLPGQNGRIYSIEGSLVTEDPAHPGTMIPYKGVPQNQGRLDPLAKEFDALLTKVEGERFGNLPAYQTPDAQYAEAVRRWYARHPNVPVPGRSASGVGGGAPSAGGSAPNSKRVVTAQEYQQLRTQYPNVDLTQYYTVQGQ